MDKSGNSFGQICLVTVNLAALKICWVSEKILFNSDFILYSCFHTLYMHISPVMGCKGRKNNTLGHY